MSARVNFLDSAASADHGPIVLVAKKAVISEGQTSYVWTVRDGKAERIAIQRGGELEQGIEVRQGLSDGDLVIVDPPPGLTSGQRVTSRPG